MKLKVLQYKFYFSFFMFFIYKDLTIKKVKAKFLGKNYII